MFMVGLLVLALVLVLVRRLTENIITIKAGKSL
jgi:hypothetical protein